MLKLYRGGRIMRTAYKEADNMLVDGVDHLLTVRTDYCIVVVINISK